MTLWLYYIFIPLDWINLPQFWSCPIWGYFINSGIISRTLAEPLTSVTWHWKNLLQLVANIQNVLEDFGILGNNIWGHWVWCLWHSLLSPPPVRMKRMERSFFFLSSGLGGRGLELWLRGVGSLMEEPIMVLVFRMGGAGGLSSTSPLSDIFSYAAVTPRLWKQ